MRILWVGILALLLCGGGMVNAKAQTLKQVLWAVENRNRLLQEKKNLANNTDNPIKPIKWGTLSDEYPSDLAIEELSIEDKLKFLRQAWTITDELHNYFVETRQLASGVGVFANIASDQFEPIVSPENYYPLLSELGRRLSIMTAMPWPYSAQHSADAESHAVTANLYTLPSPLTYSADPSSFSESELLQDATNGFLGGYAEGAGGALDISVCVYAGFWGSDSGGSTYYGIRGGRAGVEYVDIDAPNSSGGSIEWYTNFSFDVNHVRGLSWPGQSGGDGAADTLYHPGNQRWSDTTMVKGGSVKIVPPGLFGGNFSGVSFPGYWVNSQSDGYYRPDYTGQDGLGSNQLWDSIFDGQDYPNWKNNINDYYHSHFNGNQFLSWQLREGLGGDQGVFRWDGFWEGTGIDLSFSAIFSADFSGDFSFPIRPIPERLPPLRIEPNLKDGKLIIPLANSPDHQCALIWKFPEHIQTPTLDFKKDFGALSARYVLQAQGCGDWDAVYSGKPGDREDELQWGDVYDHPNGRWPTFGSYLEEYWCPVLKQLVCSTYAVSISQQGRYKYQIDFFRRDQVSQGKNATTGEYTFPTSGAVDTFVVSNPTSDDAQAGVLEIVAHKGQANEATYDLTLTQKLDNNHNVTESDWSYTGPSISKTVVVTPAAVGWDSSSGSYQITQKKTVVDTTTLDGVAQPRVTTTYWEWPQSSANQLGIALPVGEWVDTVTEASTGEATRTTTYTYDLEDQETTPGSGVNYHGIDHLTKIEQSGGPNPYTAIYDAAGQLTSYSDTWGSETVAYSDHTVTQTQKINGLPVRTLVTTYSDDMSTSTTTAQ